MNIKPADPNIANSPKQTSGRMTDSIAGSGNFGKILKDSASDQKKNICSAILEQIDAQSRELKKSLTREGVKRYCQLVKGFMKEALEQSYEVDENTHWDRYGNRKDYVIVKRINESLEELMDDVVNQEKGQINFMAKLDAIRGLLVDLFI